MNTDCWRRVLAGADLKAGSLTKVAVEGKEVLLARLEDGAVAAACPVCPHRGEDLSGGLVYLGAIDCPWHHYLYDLRTGDNRYPRNVFPADKAVRPGAAAALPGQGGGRLDLGRPAGGAEVTRTQRGVEEHRKGDAVIDVGRRCALGCRCGSNRNPMRSSSAASRPT